MISFSKTVWLLFGLCCLTVTQAVAVYCYRNHWHEEKARVEEAEKQIASLSVTIDKMQSQQLDISGMDQKYTQELTEANETIEKLRADLSAGHKRLYVKATCPKLPEGTTASGLDNATPTRLGRDAEQNYLRLREQVTQMQKQLEALQAYTKQIQH